MSDRDLVLAEFLRAVGHPTRLWMVRTLSGADEALSASGWHARRAEGDVGLGTMAYHARELFNAGLLVKGQAVRRRGAVEQFYRLSAPGEFMAQVVTQLDESSLAGGRPRG